MNKKNCISLLILIMMVSSCNNGQNANGPDKKASSSPEGSFGYDLDFLKHKDDSLVVLTNDSGKVQVIVSPRYQAKVFTSTANGHNGLSFGWVNYKAFGGVPDTHMNGYGGENRFWLGPEGGKYALFFKPASPMVFDNWHTPAPFDTESWSISGKSEDSVTMQKNMHLTNYSGSQLDISVKRSVKILSKNEISEKTGLAFDTSVSMVAYQTDNTITNDGNKEWTAASGMPCIWMLDMFKPSDSTIIVVPFRKLSGESFHNIATTNYFGEIASDRLKLRDDILFFKADGKSRGKLGITPGYAKPVAGSYDAAHGVLTIMMFDLDPTASYLNQEWNTTKPSFSGDAVNAYNDGPLADGTQMGPFYEIESVSPAAFLKPGQSLSHRHTVFHFTGTEKALDPVAQKLLGVSLEEIQKEF